MRSGGGENRFDRLEAREGSRLNTRGASWKARNQYFNAVRYTNMTATLVATLAV